VHVQPTLESLQRDLRHLRLYAVTLTAGLLVLAVSAFHSQSDRVLRVRGLIVEDAAGRERILIGAPIPFAKNRVRTDTARVRQAWAHRYPNADQYMGYYAGYRNAVNGLLVLDERGFDRLAIGDSVPDPNTGRRIGPSTGVAVNDSAGFERTGYGLVRADGHYRVVLGLDSEHGEEGLALAVFDVGGVGLMARDGQRSLFLGTDLGSTSTAAAKIPPFGLIMREGATVKKSVEISAP
jgi:hypothetical protein